jgi:hypothetical protein
LRATPFSSLLSTWDALDLNGTDVPAIRRLCLIDRYYLLIKVLHRHDAWHPWLYARCREVEASPDGHLDLWSRGHYKSTIVTFSGSIQEILRDPEITIGIFSHTAPIAKKFLAQIQREFEANEQLKALFPHILYQNPEAQAPSWSIDKGITVRRKGNPKEATVEAHGLVDGMPTSVHYRLRIYDDVVVDKSVTTPEQVQKTTDAYSLSQALGTENGRVWGIGTRYDFADTYDWILKKGGLKPRIYPATHNGMRDGRLVLFSAEEWANRLRDHTDSDISCQYMQNPLAGEARMFNVEDVQTYEVRPETLMVYILCDPARSKKSGSANTAMMVVGLDYASNKYLLDGVDHKMDLMERWQWLSTLWKKWRSAPGVQGCRIGYEAYGAQADLDYFEEQRRLAGLQLTIDLLEWPREGPGAKDDRVQRLGPDLRSHKFYVPYSTEEGRLTSLQRRMQNEGYEYRIAKPIRRKDENNHVYDLTEHLRTQIHFYPFCGLKDAIDATARIYDLEPTPPIIIDHNALEPEVV